MHALSGVLRTNYLVPLIRDYQGAMTSGMQALLVRRPGPEGDEERKEPGERLDGIQVVPGLSRVVEWVQERGAR